jgi:hypothetical protein
MDTVTHYFRYDGYEHAMCYSYPVTRRTLKGVWIALGYPEKQKFILNDARKCWAYPTKELALDSFKIRKHRQIMHSNASIDSANIALRKVGLETIDVRTRFSDQVEEIW